ncbi:MAG: DeoR family transcriptional regulator [Dehalococcoidia bacterium]|nr:DeoR family transcriptional regulator [Dehalococcoidia bacterium]
MAMLGRLETSREAILDILRRREAVSVDDLAQQLQLAGATVRRHLDVLMRDGFVAVTQVRGGTGRPRYQFSLTEAGAELFPHHYVRLTRRLIEEIIALEPAETMGRQGSELAELIFEKMAARLARECGPRMDGRTPAERAGIATELLAIEGLDFELVRDGDELRLLGRGCPCSRFEPVPAGGPRRTCDHDRRLLEALIGAPVTPLPLDALPHEFLCGYRVAAAL